MLKVLLIQLVLVISLFSNATVIKVASKALNTLIKSKNSITNEDIVKLSQMSDEINGTKEVNKYIGTLNLPQELREDIYLRISIYQNKISREEAEIMIQNLKGVEGFGSTLSKIIGNNPNGTIGHLNELRIANNASQNGFEVIAIGKKFDDGIKQQLTDIDILLRKNGRDILIEAKNYKSSTKMDLIKFRADLDTLNIYDSNISNKRSLKIFSFTEKPDDLGLLKQYQFWAKEKNVQLIFGTPEEQIEQIKILEKII